MSDAKATVFVVDDDASVRESLKPHHVRDLRTAICYRPAN
jgi:FixJ family two-component response regulator